MLSLVGWAGALLVTAGLLRVAIWDGGGRGQEARFTPAARRLLDRLPLLAFALALWHGWLAVHGSLFVLLFSLPGYIAAVILLVLHGAERRRGRRSVAPSESARSVEGSAVRPGPAHRRWAVAVARLMAVAGLALVAFSAERLVELQALRSASGAPPELRRQARELDLTGKSWPDALGALCADLAVRYPFSAWKGLDWPRRCAAAAPRVASAAQRHDVRAYYRALRELAWDIPDGHVGLIGDDHGLARQETGGDFGLRLVQLEDGRVMACSLLPGGAAERAGIRYAAEILSWNGLPIDRALAGVPILWADAPPATAEARRLDELRFLVRAPVGTQATLTYRGGAGVQPAAAMVTAAGAAAGPEREAPGSAPAGAPVEFSLGEAILGGAVDWRWLAPGLGYIRIKYELPTWGQVDPARRVRRAVASFVEHRTSGLVLDVRGNGGGLDVMVPAAVGCFLSAARVYEIPAVFNPAAGRFLPLPAHTIRAVPLSPHFSGRIALLIDSRTISSGEGFPLALRGLPNVASFGFAGTGGFFAIDQRPIRLPAGLTFVVPVGQSLGADLRIQVDSDASGRGGIAPDHRLRWTRETLDAVCRNRRDLVLEAAASWLRSPS